MMTHAAAVEFLRVRRLYGGIEPRQAAGRIRAQYR